MTLEEIDRLRAVADQRWAAYRARMTHGEDSPGLHRFAHLERQARHAFTEALIQWEQEQGTRQE